MALKSATVARGDVTTGFQLIDVASLRFDGHIGLGEALTDANALDKAADEMSHYFDYEYVIVNYDVENSVHQVQTILEAERLKRRRQIGLSDFVRQLQEGA